jgi:hypothetical protein
MGPDRGIVGRIEGHTEKFGLQPAKRAGSGNHQGCSSGDYVFGEVDDVGPQLVGKAGMCKLLIVVGDPEAKVVGALLVERGQKRVGKGGKVALAPAEQALTN